MDDSGAGYSSLSHILQLAPDFIKLDISITRLVARDAARQSPVEALAGFAMRNGAPVVAEGVEQSQDAQRLLELGVH